MTWTITIFRSFRCNPGVAGQREALLVINTSIVTCAFPQAWKHALVIPLLKKGDPNSVSNYRPISVLPIASKILEKIISNQLLNFLETNDALSNCQHGFRPRLSTESALTVVTDAIFSNMDDRKISLLTLCDLSKAFDSVRNSILLRKCAKLSIDSNWFESYLANRTQSVILKTVISIKENVSFGFLRVLFWDQFYLTSM